MIPRDFITEWRGQAPWVQDFQVEQDLVISRALYQRKQGRDLFDLAVALGNEQADPPRIVEAFVRYMDHEGHRGSSRKTSPSRCGRLSR